MSATDDRHKLKMRGLADAAFSAWSTARQHAAWVDGIVAKHGSDEAFAGRLRELAVTTEIDRLRAFAQREEITASRSNEPSHSTVAHHGFDLTHFGSAWPEFAEAAGLTYAGRTPNGRAFLWTTEAGTEMTTQNNPAHGEYGPGREQRDDEPGYASYIGLTGPKDDMWRVIGLIRKHAASIKAESFDQRRFI